MQSRITFFSALEHGELLVVQLRHEQLGDRAQMDRYGLRDARRAGIRQRDHDAACVAVGSRPTDQSLFDKPVDAAREARP